MYTAEFRVESHTENNLLEILSNAQSHKMTCFHALTGGQSPFHSTGMQHESNMASLQSTSKCLHSHIPTDSTTIIKLSVATQQQNHKSLPQPG